MVIPFPPDLGPLGSPSFLRTLLCACSASLLGVGDPSVGGSGFLSPHVGSSLDSTPLLHVSRPPRIVLRNRGAPHRGSRYAIFLMYMGIEITKKFIGSPYPVYHDAFICTLDFLIDLCRLGNFAVYRFSVRRLPLIDTSSPVRIAQCHFYACFESVYFSVWRCGCSGVIPFSGYFIPLFCCSFFSFSSFSFGDC